MMSRTMLVLLGILGLELLVRAGLHPVKGIADAAAGKATLK